MKREEVKAIMLVMQTAYPRFYANQTTEQLTQALDLWSEMFSNDDPRIVVAAVKNLITTFKYPPTIADVKEAMYTITTPNKKTAIEYWNEAEAMTRRGLYMTKEEFEQASDPVKKFFGSVAQVKQLAMTDADIINTVTKGQFLKHIDIILQRDKTNDLMLPEAKELIKLLSI